MPQANTMTYFKTHYPIVSVAIFILFIALAHLFAINTYEWKTNTISDLGSQDYERKFIMQIGFLAFGLSLCAGIAVNGLTWRTALIFGYALSVGLTGIFCTKPFFVTDSYSVSESQMHSVFAQSAGFSLCLGILVQIFFTQSANEKFVHLPFFIAIIGLSATFGLVQEYQGIVQRVLYCTSFLWLVKLYKP